MAGDKEWTMIVDFAAVPASPESRAALLAIVPLARLLELLQVGGRMDVLCKCLEKVLGSAEEDSRLYLKSEDGARLLPLGIGHPDELVRQTSVRVATSLAECDEDIAWLHAQGIILSLVCASTDSSLSVANAACNALVKAVAHAKGVEAVFAPECCEELQVRMRDDSAAGSVIRMRVLELVCRMWSVSPEAAHRCKTLRAKEQLVAILEGDDILLQLNAVEVLAYLPPQDVGEDLLSQLLTTAEESLGTGAVPARVLSSVSTFVAQQEGMVSPALQTRLCHMLAQRLPQERPGSDGAVDMLSVLAALCETHRGLAALQRSSQLPAALAPVAANLNTQHQLSKLASLSVIVSATRSAALACRADASDETAFAASCALQQALTPLVPALVKLTRVPILEERIGALCCCRSLAMHRWGVQALFATSGFVQFVIDRKEESSKRGLEVKYEIVRETLAHGDIGAVIGADNHRALVAFASDGAYYTSKSYREGAPQVGTMGAA